MINMKYEDIVALCSVSTKYKAFCKDILHHVLRRIINNKLDIILQNYSLEQLIKLVISRSNTKVSTSSIVNWIITQNSDTFDILISYIKFLIDNF